MTQPRIAIVYDRLNKFGGAEQVLLALRSAFPEAVLFTSVHEKTQTPWLGNWEVRTSFLQHIPFAKNHHEWFGWLMPLVFESLDLSSFDVVISVTSEAAKGVLTTPHQLHICYCLTPTRYLWSHTHEYGNGIFGWMKKYVFSKLRQWDFIASTRPDFFIPISKHVEKRISKFYRRECAPVIYPPVQVTHSKNQHKEKVVSNTPDTLSLAPDPYFLVVSRLVPYKKIEIAIEACMRSSKQLIVVGTGSDMARLQQVAANTQYVSFVGFVSDTELSTLYTHATALLCPQEEDFGIVSLEAQSYGLPVISYRNSGVAETIHENRTGLLFSAQTAESLEKTMHEFEKKDWDKETIKKSVESFATQRFVREFQQVVVRQKTS